MEANDDQAKHLQSAVDKVAASFAEMTARMRTVTEQLKPFGVSHGPGHMKQKPMNDRQRQARKDSRRRAKQSRKLNRR